MCLNPKWIYKKGKYKNDNYRGMEGEAYELGTYSKCGHCTVCQNEKSNNWVIRNFFEVKKWKKIAFITLTYEKNPILLYRKDFQDFMKRLRRNLEKSGYKEKIRMFECGEYGELNNRPHGHIIIYNWEDKNKKYLDINNKGSILYQSEIIQKTWGLGRTSYQEFEEHEIPYISLYETPKEEFSRAYKLSQKKCNEIKEIYKRSIKDPKRFKQLIKLLNEKEKELKKNKEEYKMIKEFNGWSIALGWEPFYEEFLKDSENYIFKTYIEDKEFITPTPWVKKLANMGYVSAIKEMYKREEEISQSYNEEHEMLKSLKKVEGRRKKELLDYIDKKDKIEYI